LAVAFMVDDSQIQAPLAPFMGEVPDAPAWFTWALAQVPVRSFVNVEGARIETLVWGEAGRPGLLLLHGHGAHADWYSFIAPFFAARYRVVAVSWSGMGASDWREAYSVEQFGREAIAVAAATGLFDASAPPVVAGHSFGGRITIGLAADHGEKFAAAVIVDPPVFAPRNLREKTPPRRGPRPDHHVHPTLAAALARFRLAPAQRCDNIFILDHVARLSLRNVPEAAGEGPGWSWRFDPALWFQLKHRNPMPLLRAARCPLALVRGGRSRLMQREDAAHMMAALPEGAPYVEIPEADHHVMLDQPLAFVAAIEALLATRPATWPLTLPAASSGTRPAQQEAAPA
jgi:pimeloyl-ACP methyl ester carboxylesterase